MTDQLDQAADAQLNELFAVEVAGWIPTGESSRGLECIVDEPEHAHMAVANFTADANEVIPWLQQHGPYLSIEICGLEWHIRIGDYDFSRNVGISQSFCRAAVIALLRAKRATSSGTSSTAPTPPPR